MKDEIAEHLDVELLSEKLYDSLFINFPKTGFSQKGSLNSHYGKRHSEETKRILSEKAKNRKRKTCEYCNKEVDSSNYSRWHGNRCKNAKTF